MPQQTGQDGDKLLPDVPSCTGGTITLTAHGSKQGQTFDRGTGIYTTIFQTSFKEKEEHESLELVGSRFQL